jgi:hypothetical protein
LSVSRFGASCTSRPPRRRFSAGALPGRRRFVRGCSSALLVFGTRGVLRSAPELRLVAGAARCSPVFCRLLRPARLSFSPARGPALSRRRLQLRPCVAAGVPCRSLSEAFRSFPCVAGILSPLLVTLLSCCEPQIEFRFEINTCAKHSVECFLRRPADLDRAPATRMGPSDRVF